ncbi:MAG: Methyltransferase-like protein 16 [Piccolia ochrophora]|nr:MAG: Methyltransferase-like protein 16 [Piccolia ochrophora]
MVTPGGEVAFVERILDESVLLKDRVQWYTSMLGKLSSVSTIVEKLKERGVANWAMAEFVQGNKTRRWAVGWSWSDMRPTMAVARNINSLPKHLMPFPSEYSFQVVRVPIDVIGQRLNTVLTEAPLQWQWRAPLATGVGFAMENVWSRASRRQRGSSDDTTHDADEIDEEEAALGFKVQLRGLKDSQNTGVVIRWLKGNDSVLFESFCGMLKRKFETSG